MRDYVISYQRQSLAITARTPFEAQNKAQPRFEMALNMTPGTLATKIHLFAVRLQGPQEVRHGVAA